jgi:hypothetical protein
MEVHELFLQVGQALSGPGFDPGVHITSMIVNGVVRLAAIAAGTYVVWLGHNTMVRGIKGDFEFSGKFYRLKGSVPGLLFVLLGCLAIGWALQAKHSGRTGDKPETVQTQGKPASGLQGTSVPPPPPVSAPKDTQ